MSVWDEKLRFWATKKTHKLYYSFEVINEYLGLNRLSAFEHDKADILKREELESNRLSVGGKGQIDNQRGLLNKVKCILIVR